MFYDFKSLFSSLNNLEIVTLQSHGAILGSHPSSNDVSVKPHTHIPVLFLFVFVVNNNKAVHNNLS